MMSVRVKRLGLIVAMGEGRCATWPGGAEAAEMRGRAGTARAVPVHLAVDLEKAHGTHESPDKLLARPVERCPQAEVL